MLDPTEDNQATTRYSLRTYMLVAGVACLVPILVVFLIGMILAIIGEPTSTAQRIATVRDVIIIIVFFELLLIVVALVGLVIQITRLVGTVQGELEPMIANTRKATETISGTARFVSRNLTGPIVSFWAVLAGTIVFFREISGIRRAIRKKK